MTSYKLSLDEIDTLVSAVQNDFKSGVIILRGDLATGKTTFVKSFVKKLSILDDVTSPTFSLQQCYGNYIFHYDLYNHGLEHFISLGMLEELEKDGYHLIEWGDEDLLSILRNAGIETLVIDIEKTSQSTREYKVLHA